MSNIPAPGQLYRHFKGQLYRIVTLAKHSETGEELVVYQALYGNYEVYAEPLNMFMAKTDKEKYPDAFQEYCFERQEELIKAPVCGASSEENAAGKESAPEGEEGFQEAPDGQQEELNIDPLVLEFLDARTYEERLTILSALQHRITDEMINIMAVALDLEIGEGDTGERFKELRTCIATLKQYECNRLR